MTAGARESTGARITSGMTNSILAALLLAAAAPPPPEATPPAGPIDLKLARSHFQEAASLCALDDGKLWGVSLDGPILFIDPATRGVVANRDAPEGGLTDAGDGVWTGTIWLGYAVMAVLLLVGWMVFRRRDVAV